MQKGRTARHSLFYCKLKLVDLFHQGVQKLSFRHLADDLTFFENEALSLAAGDAEVGLAGFAGTVDDASHDGDPQRDGHALEAGGDLVGELVDIDLGTPAARAGDDLELAWAQVQALQDLDAGRHTEIDMFSGALMRMGKELGIPMPYNEYTYHMIKALEEKNDGKFNY